MSFKGWLAEKPKEETTVDFVCPAGASEIKCEGATVDSAFIRKIVRVNGEIKGRNNSVKIIVTVAGKKFESDYFRGDANRKFTVDIPIQIPCEITSSGTVKIPESFSPRFNLHFAEVADPNDPSTLQTVRWDEDIQILDDPR